MVYNMYFSTYKNRLLVSYVFYVTTFTNTLHSIFGGLFYALFSDSIVPEDAWLEPWTVMEYSKKIIFYFVRTFHICTISYSRYLRYTVPVIK
jgi:hypothetical protein